MAIKNLQTVAVCAANIQGVRVTGMGKGTMGAGSIPASLSLPRLPLPGSYLIRTGPDAKVADNAAAARAVWAGRSMSGAGFLPSGWLARSASRTVLSKRSASFTSEHRERQTITETKTTWSRG